MMTGQFWANIQYFNPKNIGGLVLWLDANNPAANGIQPADNSALSLWVDQSGRGNDATQSSGANQPTFNINIINGKAAINFNGSTTNMLTGTNGFPTADSGRTIFMVYNPLDLPSNAYVFTFGTLATDQYFSNALLVSQFWVDIGSDSMNTTATFIENVNYLSEVNYPPVSLISTTSITINHMVQATMSASDGFPNTTLTSSVIGDFLSGGIPYDGALGEILLYNSSLDATQQSLVAQYLSEKWSI